MAYEFKVSVHDDTRRLDKVIRNMWPGLPLGAMMKYFRKGQVRVDGKKAAYDTRLYQGQLVQVPWEEPGKVGRAERPDGTIRKMPLDVIYRDEQVLVINKPAGLLSQPDKKGEDSVVTRALGYTVDDSFLPQLVHRLDRNTSGVMIIALTGLATRILTDAFRNRDADKRYWALVLGELNEEGHIDAPLLKDENKSLVRVHPRGDRAETHYYRLVTNGRFSLAEVELLTGRTHQIRVHLNHIGHPILGDAKYGDFSANGAVKNLGVSRPMLHARSLTLFDLPKELAYLNDKNFVAKCPEDMGKVLERIGFLEKDERP